MSARALRFLPASIAGQITALVVGALVVAYALLVGAVLFGRADLVLGDPFSVFLGKVTTAVQVAEAEPAATRDQALASLGPVLPGLVTVGVGAVAPSLTIDPGKLALRTTLGSMLPGRRIALLRLAADPDGSDHLGVSLADGSLMAVPLPDTRRPQVGPLLLLASSIAATLVALSIWAARQVTAPLRGFSQAAEGFGRSLADEPVPVVGPLEVRQLGAAFNEMRARIRRLVDDRTRMLAAISHDLRTPLTRLSLRVEMIEDAETRRQALADLRSMEAMLHSGLEFLRGGASSPKREPLDVATLLQTVCDGFTDVGERVVYEGPRQVALLGDYDLLTRAVTNLVDNAARHGEAVTVRLRVAEGDRVVIEVEDDGPGMSEAVKDQAFQPFFRGDAARPSREAGGFGLGLSIVRAIVEEHGGTIALQDAQPHGLRVHVVAPIRPQS